MNLLAETERDRSLSLVELETLAAQAAGSGGGCTEGDSGPAFDRLLDCLRSPAALSASFRRGGVARTGGSGPPDFAAIEEAVSKLVVDCSTDSAGNRSPSTGSGSTPGRADAHILRATGIMDVLSEALWASSKEEEEDEEEEDQEQDGETPVRIRLAPLARRIHPLLAERSDDDGNGSSSGSEEDADGDTAFVDDGVGTASVDDTEQKSCISGTSDPTWVLSTLAAALPLLEGALPRDARGETVLPHHHRMNMVEADLEGAPVRFFGCQPIYETFKMCDRCMDPIHDRVYYHCSGGCDVDFCSRCHEELQGVLAGFFASGGAGKSESMSGHLFIRMMWAVHIIDELACQVLGRTAHERFALAQLLAYEWPVEMFARLVGAVVDVCNAKMLYNNSQGAITTSVLRTGGHAAGSASEYIQEVRPIYRDTRFWCCVGFLQFLYACNSLTQECVVDGCGTRGSRISCQSFILEGINKCHPEREWRQWLARPLMKALDVLRVPRFRISRSFRSLVAHNNLLPISFRRRCLLEDVWQQVQEEGGITPLELQVAREPDLLVDAVVSGYSRKITGGDATIEEDVHDEREKRLVSFRRPLHIVFKGEAGHGPGVRREFFQVAIRAFLGVLFTPTINRTYWFSDVNRPDAYFACGVLLGQAVIHDVLIPRVFPSTLFDLLLRDLGSPHAKTELGLPQLAAVSPEEAKSLKCVLEHSGDDIRDAFGDLGWERTGSRCEGLELSQATKNTFVQAYIDWCFEDRIRAQFGPLSEGFRAVLGNSAMVQSMVDATHLERILCGGEVPVDIAVLRRRAVYAGWQESEQGYVDNFWSVLAGLDEDAQRRFIVFVTASDRVPLRGWEELRLTVQKNGSGDDRLPTAYTCFALLMLPMYSSTESLRANLVEAINNSEGFGLQ